jgi:tRNA(Arg) A34 adenosine deaminase TadA
MQRAIDLARRALDEPGTEPFGAVVVKDGAVIGEGLNRAASRFDPTSHGEVEAIRDACRKLECTDLSGCDLYSSCEPCALCVAAMQIAGIRRLYYAASLDQSDRALEAVHPKVRSGIDAVDLRMEAGRAVEERRMRSVRLLDADAVAVLDSWAAKHRGPP